MPREALNRTGPGWLLCLCRAQGQRGCNAGSSICRQNSPPSGVGCFTNLPHTLTGSIRTYTHTHTHTHTQLPLSRIKYHILRKCVCRSTHARFLKNPQACKSETHIQYSHTLTCSSLHLFSCVLFFPLQWFPSQGWRIVQPQGTERVRWLTAGSLEVEEPLKQRCCFLSHPDRQHWNVE